MTAPPLLSHPGAARTPDPAPDPSPGGHSGVTEHTGSTALRSGLSALTRPVVPVLRRLVGPVTPLGGVALGAAAVCLLIAWLFAWQEFAVVALVIVTVLAVSALFLIGRSSYAVTLTLHHSRVVAGQRATGTLVTTNTGNRRLLPARIELPVGQAHASFRIPSLGPGAGHDDLFVIPTERRSMITVGPAISVRGDALGLLRRQVRWTDPTTLYVHPKTVALHGSSTGVIRDLEGQPTKDLSSNDVSFHALRQYVPGDDRRYVHWRTSARTGVLMVRQFEETRRTHVAIALGVSPADYDGDAEFELAISVAASVGAQAIGEERPLSMFAGAGALPTPTRRRLLDSCCAIESADAGGVLVAARAAANAVPNASVAVLVSGSRPDPAVLRRAGTAFAAGIRVIVVRVQEFAPAAVSRIADIDVATVGALDALPRALRAMRGRP